jgi:hypothetical protein
VTFYAFAGLMVCVSISLGVAFALDSREPVQWGTFIEEDCEDRARGGCRSIGTWVSDDGATVKQDIYLDGYPGFDGTARAGYRPGIMNNDDIVHTEFWLAAGPWVPWGFGVIVSLWAIGQAYSWGHLRIGRS